MITIFEVASGAIVMEGVQWNEAPSMVSSM
jgi:hypothetical protein